MITLSSVKWNIYHGWEGPVFPGNMPVPKAGIDAPFHNKVLAVTAAAEGGGFNAVQLWDSGLCSVGAIQFIDAGSFNVCNMLGEVAERCGLDKVLETLKPALDLSGAMFFKIPDGKWRFSLNGATVNTAALQRKLYFGDAQGNTAGTYTDAKRLLTKTWVVCMANVWDIPGATDVQSDFTLRNLKTGFTWGNLKADLFSKDDGSMDHGYLGATRAMLLAYAVNAPAVVVKRYDVARSNAREPLSAAWCLEVLRGVVIDAGIDVWKARWAAKLPLVEAAFGVKLPSYAQLAARSWVIDEPPPPATPDPVEPDPAPAPPTVDPPEPEPQPEPAPKPEPAPLAVESKGWASVLSMVFAFARVIMEVAARAFGKR